MLTARLHKVQWLSPQGLHQLAYREWGDPDNPHVLLCVHGLTRSSADFDAMAQDLGKDLRVVAADMPGRGASDWLPDPALYAVSTYVSACVALVARLNPEVLDWFGTSMGGLIGMGYACLPNNPIRKLILNDVGPTLNFNALQRIGEYVGKPVQFQTLDEARNYIRTISQPFGPHTESQWSALTDSVLVQKDQYWIPHYDPAIGQAFQNLSESTTLMHEAALWAAYDAIKADTLVVRGEHSDLLNHLTVENMRQRGPKARVVEVQGVGHAPTFVQNEQIHLVRDFLL
ncbi:pimeloyl-ACP methyl ester carboxylesterase [Limnobacter thiooxidans]|uniref:Alpha/beta hydrolase n=1 Tax=Limnobacter thiooxidans TaxID=131080 RepID=A0AA86IY78_9BURK|nr:pimeloyl-ACP methyl ester carboxylesterase [Limnobacter thiooxidans]BET25607.1 alpha/beta hydrolase [Limnobacter thiooxidans]